MVYICNKNLKNNLKVSIALREIYGIGPHVSRQICDRLGLSNNIEISQLTNSQLEKLTECIDKQYFVGGERENIIRKNQKRLLSISCYRGFRYVQGLPVRGQRTHGNARTSRKIRLKI